MSKQLASPWAIGPTTTRNLAPGWQDAEPGLHMLSILSSKLAFGQPGVAEPTVWTLGSIGDFEVFGPR